MKCLKVVVNSRDGQIQKIADKLGEMSWVVLKRRVSLLVDVGFWLTRDELWEIEWERSETR
jgi:hypothetical protein